MGWGKRTSWKPEAADHNPEAIPGQDRGVPASQAVDARLLLRLSRQIHRQAGFRADPDGHGTKGMSKTQNEITWQR